MKIIQFNPDVGRRDQIVDRKNKLEQIKAALEGPEIDGPLTDYETLPVIEDILTNAKLVFPDEVWRDWEISRQPTPILEVAEKVINEASRHIPMWDWVEPENTAWQMDRLRIYPQGIDIYDEDALDQLREPERLFAHIHIENISAEDIYLAKPEALATVYPDLDLNLLTEAMPDLSERLQALGLTGGRQHLHICAQIGMMQTGNMLLDYSETELLEAGYEHPEWREYRLWAAEAKRAGELQICSNTVADWVEENPKGNMKLVIDGIHQAAQLSMEELYEARASWTRKGLGSRRW
jgi:hypothetical protein